MTSDTGDLALTAEGIGKWYPLRRATAVGSLAEAMSQGVRRRVRREPRPEKRGFWALDDISFELRRSEALGIVGRNGAGKSTLLKIASRITPPTAGRVVEYGRVGSLLEVGAGFHPELSGRENVFLNGAILGMPRREVSRKLDAIVDFSGIGRFLDSPVKHYSSGMHVRLAFSVAAHLEPEILLIDEVLAVGDVDFQRKCLGKMRDVAEEGRAVVFVSHNLSAIQRLCDRAILLEEGRAAFDGAPGAVVAEYLRRSGTRQRGGRSVVPDGAERFGSGEVRVREVALRSLDGRELTAVRLGQPVQVSLVLEASSEVPEAAFEVGICTSEGERIATAQNIDLERPGARLRPGRHEVSAELRMTLLPGEYTLDVGVHRRNGRTMDYLEQALRFSALNVAESGADHYPWPSVRGYLRPESHWSDVVAAGHRGERVEEERRASAGRPPST
jgi:lipopolysaccharide transport system ATP-binding protein